MVLAFHPNDDDIMLLEFSQHIIMCNIREARLAEVSASPYYYDKIHSARPVFPLVFPWYQYLLDTNRRPPPPPRIPTCAAM
ncbi:hypothetical protein CerSpe_139340 [Prunus speciosa]